MKTSNIFLLTAAILMATLFVLPKIFGPKYVTREEKQQNLENRNSFDKNLYNYRPIALETFDQVLIVDTNNYIQRNNGQTQAVCWIPSDTYGLKVHASSNFGNQPKIEGNKLVLYRNNDFYSSQVLYIYAPHIKKFTVQKASISFAALQADSMAFSFESCTDIHLNANNKIKKLNIQSVDSKCWLQNSAQLKNLTAQLNEGSVLSVQADTVLTANITGDSKSQVEFSPVYDEKLKVQPLAKIDIMTYNDAIKEVKLKDCEVLHLQGKPQQLVLDMSFQEAKETIAKLAIN
ncbi:hypothetical protein GCM10023231_13850 [Olivibacter ginsenosidimutans]|uniref:Auto-transporter adhesin head GIN domain-containing protein n=1 Tax=Olivibacter ginsenosidimutans TaxID=1176537 RepID=A0ABP9AVS3_9SPHI